MLAGLRHHSSAGGGAAGRQQQIDAHASARVNRTQLNSGCRRHCRHFRHGSRQLLLA